MRFRPPTHSGACPAESTAPKWRARTSTVHTHTHHRWLWLDPRDWFPTQDLRQWRGRQQQSSASADGSSTDRKGGAFGSAIAFAPIGACEGTQWQQGALYDSDEELRPAGPAILNRSKPLLAEPSIIQFKPA